MSFNAFVMRLRKTGVSLDQRPVDQTLISPGTPETNYFLKEKQNAKKGEKKTPRNKYGGLELEDEKF